MGFGVVHGLPNVSKLSGVPRVSKVRRKTKDLALLLEFCAFFAHHLLTFNFDGLVKSQKTPFSVIPAEAGIQGYKELLDPGVRRGDGLEDFLRTHQL